MSAQTVKVIYNAWDATWEWVRTSGNNHPVARSARDWHVTDKKNCNRAARVEAALTGARLDLGEQR